MSCIFCFIHTLQDRCVFHCNFVRRINLVWYSCNHFIFYLLCKKKPKNLGKLLGKLHFHYVFKEKIFLQKRDEPPLATINLV